MLFCRCCVVRWVSTHGFQCGICELHAKDPQNVTSQRQPAGFWFAEQESAAHPRGQDSSSLAVLDHPSECAGMENHLAAWFCKTKGCILLSMC